MSKSASKDPHYQKILDALGGRLDPHLFEQCVVDLLRENFPALVPIPGGDDAGMDGAIADGEGEAYPFVATTDQHPIRNLTRSLDSYLAKGGRRRKVVMATSTALTARQRRNLKEKAKERKFTLVQLFEQRALADRLYRCSRWAKELLGVTGRPAALSAVPMSRRPLREDVELIGRDEDLAWLRETSGDRILAGQPGSGKTFLALQLVREGRALFLADDDPANVANALRDLQPPVIVVDDAHVDLGRLDQLCHLRQETQASFDILAITWPGQEDDVADALGGLSSSGVRKLEGLTRREVVEVLRSLGIRLPDDDPHLRHLVDQAANKPGLAVTLGSLWLRGEWEEIVSGHAIRQSLIPSLKRVLEDDPVRLLACFALGGKRGVEMEVVREFLGLDREKMHRRAAAASHGGVLTVRRTGKEEQVLAVEPEALRAPLLQEVFFAKGPTLPWRELLERVKDRGTAIEGLVTATLRGVEVPRGELRELVGEAGTDQAWKNLAYLDETEARWVIENSPRLADVAGACLARAPTPTVRRLLEEAAQGPPESAQGKWPLQTLRRWVQELTADPEQPLSRRQLVIEEALASIGRGEDRKVALQACLAALSPQLHHSGMVVTGGGVITRSALLNSTAVTALSDLWKQVIPRLSAESYGREIWGQLEDLIRQWAKPRVFLGSKALSEEDFAAYRSLAAQMLKDLTPLGEEHPGIAVLLSGLAQSIDLDLALAVDPGFELLYSSPPPVDPVRYQEEREEREDWVRTLAEDWRSRPPEDVGRQLQEYRREAEQFLGPGAGSPHLKVLYRELARLAEDPAVWIRALIEHGAPANSLAPFLDRALEEGTALDEVIQECLSHPKYAAAGAFAALQTKGLSATTLENALEVASIHEVSEACAWRRISSGTLARLLSDPRVEIAAAAAVGEWEGKPRGEVRSEIEDEWRSALLRIHPSHAEDNGALSFGIEQIFEARPDLAAAWLQTRLNDPEPIEIASKYSLHAKAAYALSENQRLDLIAKADTNRLSRSLIHFLVRDSPAAYKHLLEHVESRRLQLKPLQGRIPDENWTEQARLALEAGHDPREIALQAFQSLPNDPMITSGFGIEHWERWRQGFERLGNTTEGALREVARYGLEEAEKRIEEGREHERRFALTGQFEQLQ